MCQIISSRLHGWWVRATFLGLWASLLGSGFASAPQDRDTGDQRPTTSPFAEQGVVVDPEQIALAKLAVAEGGPAAGKRDGKLEPVVLFTGGAIPTTFAFSQEGRLLVAFPRWTTATNFTAAEVKDGRLVPFPDARSNQFEPLKPETHDPKEHLVSVQAIVVDPKNRAWILDTGSINLQPPIEGATKLWAIDIESGERVKEINLADAGVVKERTYINDARFDMTRGDDGHMFITDSGEGGIIVVDIASGRAWRKLDGHESVKPKQDVELKVEGQPLKQRPPGTEEEKPVLIASDGIAISPDSQTLYYTPLTGRQIYSVDVAALVEEDADDDDTVKLVARKASANDGIDCDAEGRIYTTDFEDNAIRRFDPRSRAGGAGQEGELIVQDERLLWPDGVIVRDGFVYVTSNQLHRQPQFHRGKSRQQQPFVLFRFPVEGARQQNQATERAD